MGKKKGGRNIRRNAGQKKNLQDIPLIVEQVGNRDGIPSCAPGLTNVINEPGDKNNDVTEKTIQSKKMEKEEQPSAERPDGKSSQPRAKEAEIGRLQENTEALTSKANPDSAMNKDRIAANPKVNMLRRLFEENNQASPDWPNAKVNSEANIETSEREETIVSKASSNLLSQKNDATLSKSHGLEEFRRMFKEISQDSSEWANANLLFETSMNDASLGSLLDITSDDAVKSPIHSVKHDTNGEGKTKISHRSVINCARRESERDRKKLAGASDAIKTSRKLKNIDKISEEMPAAISARRGTCSDERRKPTAHSARGNYCKPPVRHQTMKEVCVRRPITSAEINDDTRSQKRRPQKPFATGRNLGYLHEDMMAISRTSRREPSNHSRQEKYIQHESLKMLRTDTEYAKHELCKRTSKTHDKQVRRNVSKTPCPALESIGLKESSKFGSYGVRRESSMSKQSSCSRARTCASQKPGDEKKYHRSSSVVSHGDRKRKTSPASLHKKSVSMNRERPGVRRSLLTSGFSKILAGEIDESATRELEHRISNVILQVMETVENKVVKECFVEKKPVRSKSCYPFRR